MHSSQHIELMQNNDSFIMLHFRSDAADIDVLYVDHGEATHKVSEQSCSGLSVGVCAFVLLDPNA